MTPTMPFEFGDVVLVSFPFTSQAVSKKQPAVVVSNRRYNTARPDVVLMPVTSQLRSSTILGEVWIGRWHVAGLLKPSAVKPVFATLERTLVLRQLVRLTAGDRPSPSRRPSPRRSDKRRHVQAFGCPDRHRDVCRQRGGDRA